MSGEAAERKRKIAEYERALRAEEAERIAKSTEKMKVFLFYFNWVQFTYW